MVAGSLDVLSTGNATTGSAFGNSIHVNAGQIFSFDWVWDSNESNSSSYNDFAFVTLDLDGISLIADTSTADNSGGTFSWLATSTGTLNYGVGILDVRDSIVDSFLTVSNVQAVPEPSTLAIFALSIMGLSLIHISEPTRPY